MNPSSQEPDNSRELQMIHGKDANEKAVDHDKDANEQAPASAPQQQQQQEETTTTTTEDAAQDEELVDENDQDPSITTPQDDTHEQDTHNTASAAAGDDEDTTSSSSMNHDKDTSENSLQTAQEIYESQFPTEPETPRAVTSYALFSSDNLNRFTNEGIQDSTHYLTDELKGVLWLDDNGDGKRGSASDPTLNALEYDTGLGGVKVTLVDCATDTPVTSTTSQLDEGEPGKQFKITEYETAGQYHFSLDSTHAEGRYYIMYEAPTNYRVSGNVLPLQQATEGGTFDCIPSGGEGMDYLNQAQEQGDLDNGGYCARSIGCFEIDKKFNLVDKFGDIEYMKDLSEYEGTHENIVALPSEVMLNVGLAPDVWPLSTHQFADATITLNFPGSISEEVLESAVPSNFGSSDIKQTLEATMSRVLNGGEIGNFTLEGLEFVQGEIVTPDNEGGTRGLRGLQGAPTTQVKYTITTRGSYKPPPYEPLGTFVQDSINRDPKGLVKSLKDKEVALPPVFEEVEEVTARHLTIKVQQPKETLSGLEALENALNEPTGMAKWATVPIILCALGIFGLTGALLFRRMFTRRVSPTTHDGKIQKMKRDPFADYINTGSGFAVSQHDPEEDKLKKSRNFEPDDIKVSFTGTMGSSHRQSHRSASSRDTSTVAGRSVNSNGSRGSRGGRGRW